MKLKRRQFGITKQTTKYAIVFAIGGLIFLAINFFFTNYEFQSPIRSKWISPIPENSKSVVLPLEGFEDPKATEEGEKETPSPTPSVKKRTFIPVVEASEIQGNPVKEYIVEKFGKDAPIMLKVSQCESGTQAYNWYNKWLGVPEQEADEKGYAVGVFMIYRSVHKHLSFQDMLDYKKNIDYAYGLFQANGTAPWNSSIKCWNK